MNFMNFFLTRQLVENKTGDTNRANQLALMTSFIPGTWGMMMGAVLANREEPAVRTLDAEGAVKVASDAATGARGERDTAEKANKEAGVEVGKEAKGAGIVKAAKEAAKNAYDAAVNASQAADHAYRATLEAANLAKSAPDANAKAAATAIANRAASAAVNALAAARAAALAAVDAAATAVAAAKL